MSPLNATQSVNWSSSNTSVATVDADGTVTAKKAGTVTITASSKLDSSKKASRTVKVVNCGISNSDVTKHKLSLQKNGYYKCSECNKQFKSPVLQDKEVLSNDDYLKVISLYQTASYHAALKATGTFPRCDYALFLNEIDNIRSDTKYVNKYEYSDKNNVYVREFANIPNSEDFYSSVNSIDVSTVTEFNYIYHSGLLESVAYFLIGMALPSGQGLIFSGFSGDNINTVTDMLSFWASCVGYPAFGTMIDLISLGISANSDLSVDDKVVYINSSVGATAMTSKYVYDKENNLNQQVHNHSF